MKDRSSFAQMFTVAKYQFLNYVRSKRLFILLGITIAISVVYLVVIWKYVNPEYMSSNEFLGNWASFSTFLIVLSALFFGGDAISSEYGKKTGYFLFPNPIKRWTILWGKFFASIVASLIVVLLYWGIAFIDTFAVKGYLTNDAYYSLALALLYLLSLLALTYMFSSFFKNSAISITITAILYFFVFNIVSSIAMLTGIEPLFSITYAGDVIENVLKHPYPEHIQVLNAGGMKITMFNVQLMTGIEIMLVYFVISSIIATLVFTYRELR